MYVTITAWLRTDTWSRMGIMLRQLARIWARVPFLASGVMEGRMRWVRWVMASVRVAFCPSRGKARRDSARPLVRIA